MGRASAAPSIMEMLVVVLCLILAILVGMEVLSSRTTPGPQVVEGKAWARAARRLGVAHQHTGYGSAGALLGEVDGVTVRVVDRRPTGKGMHIVALPSGWLPEGLYVARRQTVAEDLGPRAWTGDDAFDEAIRVHGDPLTAAAILDGARRELLTRVVVEDGVTVEAGGLFWWTGDVIGEARALEARVHDLVDAAAALAFGAEAPKTEGLLLRNLIDDPHVGVRRRSLAALFDGGRTNAALNAARQALTDPDPGLRLEAATQLGSREGFASIVAVAGDPACGDDVRLKAIGIIHDAVRRLEISSNGHGLASAAVHALKERGLTDPVGALVAAADGASPPVAAAVAKTLGALADARGERALLALLTSEAPSVVSEAASALGHAGTRSARDPLRRLAESRQAPRANRLAARTALERLDARL